MDKHLQILGLATEYLAQANIAIPLVFGLVASISAIIKGVTGSGPTLTEIADQMERQLAQNDEQIRAEIARLRLLLG